LFFGKYRFDITFGNEWASGANATILSYNASAVKITGPNVKKNSDF
jgi:hypothetical protein